MRVVKTISGMRGGRDPAFFISSGWLHRGYIEAKKRKGLTLEIA